MTATVNMIFRGGLGELLSDHLEPPAWYDRDDEDEEGYSAADRAMDEAIDEMDERMLEEARSELI